MSEYITFLKDYLAFAQGNPLLLAIPTVGMVIWFFSGCYSASIAEARIRNPWIHFVLGIALPVVYPLVILFKLSVYVPPEGEGEGKETEKSRQMEGPPPVETAPPAMAEAGAAIVDTQMVDSPDLAFDKSYFKQVAIDVSGNHRGPFIFKIQGNELKVEKILDSLDDAVILEFVSADGKTQSIRAPYKNIESCKEV